MENTVETKMLLDAISTSGATSATTTTPVKGFGFFDTIQFELYMASASGDAGDSLSVSIQTTLDGGDFWFDVVTFNAVAGNASASAQIAKISDQLSQAVFNSATALSAGSVRNIMTDQYRVSYSTTDVDNDSSFVFAVLATCK